MANKNHPDPEPQQSEQSEQSELPEQPPSVVYESAPTLENPPVTPEEEEEKPEEADETPNTEEEGKPVKPEPEPEKPKPVDVEEPSQSDNKTSDDSDNLKARLTKALIKAHKVPGELVGLLPSDPDDLEAFLESDKYAKLANKLSSEPKELPKPKEGKPAPAPDKRESRGNPRDALTRIGLSVTGGSL